MSEIILDIKKISVIFNKMFFGRSQTIKAIDNVSLQIFNSETFGIVGESGSGKSTLGNAMIGLQTLSSGEIFYKEIALPLSGTKDWVRLRRQLQIIFQDPFTSLNPRRTIGQSLAEPIITHNLCSKNDVTSKVLSLLDQVGLNSNMAERYPNAFSGGQLQRICIARALAVQPQLIICDEITSALDVSTQAQIISLLKDLKLKQDLSLVFISHDLGLVRNIADRILVMYLGRIVEIGSSDIIFSNPKHPYTQALINAAPIPEPSREAARVKTPLFGEIPDPQNPPSGCFFRTRCNQVHDRCLVETPELKQVKQGQFVSCHNTEAH